MVLVEDMVSRKHAKITTDDAVVTIQDSGRRTGPSSMARRSVKRELKDGDRILIGTSIIKMVFVEGDATNNATRQRDRGAVEDGGGRQQAHARRSRCREASRRSRCPI